MKFLNNNKVLCLSPHPDDIEYSMLGSMMLYNETQFDVLCLTVGGAKGYDPTNNENRRNELINLYKMYDEKNKNVNLMMSKNNYFEDLNEAGWINYLEKNYLNKNNYDCIFVPPIKDSMYEHRFVHGFGNALVRRNTISVIEYHTPSTLNVWKPNVFIDIKNKYEDKLKLLSCFTSQLSKLYFKKNTLDSFHSNFQCRKRGMDVVEQFKVIELFGTDV